MTKDQNALWKNLSKDNRYEINRAGKRDYIIYEFLDYIDISILNEFINFYNVFASQQGLKTIDKPRLTSYLEAGVLNLSRVKLNDGKVLVWHAYYCSQSRAFLLHSVSHRKSSNPSFNYLIGRANRYHHWQDILKFKELGILTYDFGGWYPGKLDKKRLSINRFKEEFGGEIVRNFNCRCGFSLKGKLFLLARNTAVILLDAMENAKHRLRKASY